MSQTLLHRAIRYAVNCHGDQLRKKSNLPYVVHPIEVMKIVHSWGYRDDDILAAAVLHDVLEDTPIPEEAIANNFSPRIGRIVASLSWPGKLNKKAKFDHLTSLPKIVDSPDILAAVLPIKMADRLCNASDYRDEASGDPYYSKYALMGYPAFWHAMTLLEDAPFMRSFAFQSDMDRYQSLVTALYPDFDLLNTGIDKARMWLFPDETVWN